MKRLETERLILRSWSMADAEDMYEYARTPKVGPMAGWKPHESLEETKQILAMFIEENDSWAIECKENHKVIGSLGFHETKRGGLSYDREIGYVIGEPYWGRGIVVEAVKALMEYAFCELQMSALMVAHFSFNKQSNRVIEKLGFEHQKKLVNACVRYDGVVLDDELYMMTREQYFVKE